MLLHIIFQGRNARLNASTATATTSHDTVGFFERKVSKEGREQSIGTEIGVRQLLTD